MSFIVTFAPCFYEKLERETVQTLIGMSVQSVVENKFEFGLIVPARGFITALRTSAAEVAFADNRVKYILYIDQDMILPQFGAVALVEAAEKFNLPIVSGYYSMRHKPFHPLIFRETQKRRFYRPVLVKSENACVPADATGLGCCLIRRDVFETVKKPWFVVSGTFATEDVYFFQKTAKKGIPLMVHTGVQCGHIGQYGAVFPFRSEWSEKSFAGNKIYSDEYLAAHKAEIIEETESVGENHRPNHAEDTSDALDTGTRS